MHALLKWSRVYLNGKTRDAILEHHSIGNAQGSVWWGQFGSGRPPANARFAAIDQQLRRGQPTFAFLSENGENARTSRIWRAEVLAMSADPTAVDFALMPSYYTADQCTFFVRLRNFESLDRRAFVTAYTFVDPAKDLTLEKLQGHPAVSWLTESV